MKNKIFISFFVVIVGIAASLLYLKAQQPTEQDLAILEMKKISGSAITEEKQPFEDHIRELLTLSVDDKIRGFGIHDIDMEGRKKFFSPEGWHSYGEYIKAHKKIISTKGTQAKGRFCYGSSDAYDCGADQFQINVQVSGDLKNPEEMVIKKWDVIF